MVPRAERPKAAGSSLRHRLAPQEREKMIVAEAIRYFAEFGFAAPTRGLAWRVGIRSRCSTATFRPRTT